MTEAGFCPGLVEWWLGIESPNGGSGWLAPLKIVVSIYARFNSRDKCIGANCPEMAGTVPDLAPLSLVPYGSCYSPWMSPILKVASLELGY